MRKADYATLADIFKRHRWNAYKSAANADSRGDKETALFNEGKAAALELAADCFSREASVNRAEFLKACDITP